MPRYRLGFSGTAGGPANNAAYFDIWSATRIVRVRELAFFNISNATALVGSTLIRTSARGTQNATITPTAVANSYNTADINPTVVVDNGWTVQPTFAALNMGAIDIAASVQSGIVWIWNDERDGTLLIPIGGGLAVQNTSGGALATTPRCWLDWEE